MYKNGQLFQINDDEGRILYANTVYTYEFDYKDYLGNSRVSFKAEGNQLIKTAETHFDLWGVKLVGIGSTNAVQNRWEYQGKEKESTFHLNRINLGVRGFNPTIGLFDRIDPLADKYYALSPYNYTFNNPVNVIDLFGLEGEDAQELIRRNYYNDGYSTWESFGRMGTEGNLYQITQGPGDGDKKGAGKQQQSKAQAAGAAILTGVATDAAIPDPSDVIPQKWVAATAAVAVGGILLYGPDAVDYLKRNFDPGAFYYVTYTKTSKDGKVYVGRTSGFGDPATIVKQRDYGHHMNAQGYGTAQLSTAAQSTSLLGYTFRLSDPAYWSIRGSEQLQIESYRRIGISGNVRNGISQTNKYLQRFLDWGNKF